MAKIMMIIPALAGLLHMLNAIDGLERIRFLTSHPNYFTDDIIEAVADLPKVMPHIEIPAQAGDDIVWIICAAVTPMPNTGTWLNTFAPAFQVSRLLPISSLVSPVRRMPNSNKRMTYGRSQA
jgi:hypothetical protein